MKYWLLILSIFCASEGRTQSWWQPATEPLATSVTYSQQADDAFAFTGNRAALTRATGLLAGLYGSRRFMMEGLGQYQVAVVIPGKWGYTGLDIRLAGGGGYRERKFGFAYAKKMTNNLSLGAQFNYQSVGIAGYGSSGTLSADIAMMLQLSKRWQAGLQWENPFGARIGIAKEESYPSIYRLGIGYEAGEELYIQGELIRQDDQALQACFTMQYHPVKQVSIRAGIRTQNNCWMMGIGFRRSCLLFFAIAEYQQHTGFSPGILLLLTKNKQGEN